MVNIINVIRNKKYKIQKNGYIYTDFLKQHGITDEFTLSVAKKHNNITIPYDVSKTIEDLCDFNNYTIFTYKTTYDKLYDDGCPQYFKSGIPVPKSGIINIETTYSKSANLWQLLQKLASLEKDEVFYLIKIPNSYLNNNVPLNEDGVAVLYPEFIYGIANITDKKISIIKNENYSDNHKYLDYKQVDKDTHPVIK